MERRDVVSLALVLVFLVLVPAVTFAQSGIAGVAKDTSGGVLPGVTVEAASPVLIEKVRTAVTDDQGRYNIVDLRPGVYTVTFTLTGFNTFKREDLDLPSSFTATVNAEMPVGALEETVTVTGQTPVVDLQSTAKEITLSKEMLEAVPTGRLPQSYMVLVPGVVQSTENFGVGLHNSFVQANLQFHGGPTDSQVNADGFQTRHMNVVGGAQYSVNQGTVQEVVVSAGMASAEQQAGGVVSNAIPKEGSNKFGGQFYFHYTNEHFLGDNLTDALRAIGASTQSIRRAWDYNPVVGGPIKQDRLWFLASYRNTASEVDSGYRFDVNPLDWVYTPDLSRPSASERIRDRNHSLRLTWQATPRNKVSAYYDHQPKDWYNRAIGGSHQGTPEASEWAPYLPQYLAQVVWRSPVSNRLMIEAGTSYQNTVLNMFPNDHETTNGGPTSPDLRAISAKDLDTNITFRGPDEAGIWHKSRSLRSRAAASYVTGTHAFKVGLDLVNGPGVRDRLLYQNGDYTVSLRSGVPVSITLFGPEFYTSRINPDLGVYTQDQWTIGRATLNLGARYDYLRSSVPAQDVPASRFLLARHFDPVGQVLGWHDLSPRLGLAYDLFGNGRTAFKAGVNRYVASEGTGTTDANNPVLTSVISATRNWTDTNGNFLPDCDFSNPASNGECGVLSNLNFGKQNPRATRYDPAVLQGFGRRGYNWETAASIQHQLVPGLAVEGAYFRRWFGNLTATDNQLVAPADFDPFCLTLPVNSRLPDGGGNQLCGFYDVTPTRFGQTQNLVTFASNFGKRTQVYNGVEFTVSARLRNGAQFSGGTSTGRTATSACFVVDSPQALMFCDVKPPFQTYLKLIWSYPLAWGIQASGALQSVPGPEISTTTYVATSSEVKPTLGRNLASGASGTVTLPLMQAGTVFGDAFSKLDVRLSKIFRVSRTRFTGSLDILNVLNGAGIAQVTTRYGPNWLKPTQIVGARLFRLSARVDF